MILFPLITMILTTILSKLITRSWLSPATVFSSFWFIMITLPIILTPDYNIGLNGIWTIVIMAMAISSGSFLALRPYKTIKIKNISSLELNTGFLQKILIIISSFGISALISFSLKNYGLDSFLNGILFIPNFISIDRYAGLIDYPLIIKLSLYCIYPASLLGGIIIGLRPNSLIKKSLGFSPIIIAIILGFIEGTRSNIILSIVLFSSGYLALKSFFTEEISKYKILMGLVFFALLFTILFIFVQWLRQGMDSLSSEFLLERLKAYYFGYLAAFTQWFEKSDIWDLNGGFNTFAGPFNLIGLADRSFGFYDPIVISPGVSTNIYTAFRGLISDFTYFGTIILFFFIGFLFQTSFNSVRCGNYIFILPLSIFYAFTAYSPIISIFHYNSIISAWIIVSIPFVKQKLENFSSYS